MHERISVKVGWAIGMRRSANGYVKKANLSFAISEDDSVNKMIIDDFARKNHCVLVEVWEQNMEKWEDVKPYKIYSYLPALSSAQFEKLRLWE